MMKIMFLTNYLKNYFEYKIKDPFGLTKEQKIVLWNDLFLKLNPKKLNQTHTNET